MKRWTVGHWQVRPHLGPFPGYSYHALVWIYVLCRFKMTKDFTQMLGVGEILFFIIFNRVTSHEGTARLNFSEEYWVCIEPVS